MEWIGSVLIAFEEVCWVIVLHGLLLLVFEWVVPEKGQSGLEEDRSSGQFERGDLVLPQIEELELHDRLVPLFLSGFLHVLKRATDLLDLVISHDQHFERLEVLRGEDLVQAVTAKFAVGQVEPL